jgi:hypothetical protein
MFIYTIGDILTGVVVFGVGGLYLVFYVLTSIKQSKCKHERFYETSACDAVCTDCGKNLGFIGNIRKSR